MTIVKAYVRDNNTAAITCPSCNKVRNIHTSQVKGTRRAFQVRCTCNTTFKVQLDSRRHFRKPVNLPGSYMIIRGGHGGGIMHVHNISMGGVGFTVSGMHQLKVGQLVQLEFQLIDKNQTSLTKKVLVKTVVENTIGSEFTRDQVIHKALGFFLRF